THRNKLANTVLLAVALVLGASPAARADKGHDNDPGILPPNSRLHGKTYGEWAVAWWQWVMSIPADRNPLNDQTGEFANEGQSGPVWFLAGTFGDSVERTYTVPPGKSLFLPVFNCIFGAGVFDCDPTVPGAPCVVCDLQHTAAENTECIDVLQVTIDGKPVRNVRRYRAASPGPFAIHYPENSVAGVPEGNYFPQVADGYWLMLDPLSKGAHEVVIRVRGETPYFGHVEYVVIHHINVGPALVVPADDRYRGKTYSEWSAKSAKLALELPLEGHPALDTNPNFDASYAKHGNVWFLGGPFGTNERTVTIPASKSLLFVLINTECSSLEPPESGFHGDTEAEQRDRAKFWSDHIVNPFFVVDDEAVPNIGDVRFGTPQYEFDAPTPWLFGEVGGHGTSVADGYYVMLQPMDRGAHTVHFGGSFHFAAGEVGPDPVDLPVDMTYHITVVPGGHDRDDDDCHDGHGKRH
ncbi:MAG TPA: hypothetical protein VHI52_01695, partial [Verrucomicrobiae bacterium]|nr:hypothetical protein [Verrucomicrobiae bacterium]